MMTSRLMQLMLVAAILSSGCTKPDWIQSTLVTADVTGVWVGNIGRGGWSSEARLELEQQGSKVTGNLRWLPPYPPWNLVDGPVEGTVSGDLFTFKQANGVLVGETTVNGDEMRANLTGRLQILFQRVNSSAPPSSK